MTKALRYVRFGIINAWGVDATFRLMHKSDLRKKKKMAKEMTKVKNDIEMFVSEDLKPFVADGFEIVQTGGVTKWIDLKKFQVDEKAPQNKPVKGNGKMIEGVLMGIQDIEDEKGEENEDGVKVRHFFNIRLTKSCPVAYKDENKVVIEEECQPGDIVAIGERTKLSMLRQWALDGGIYQILLQPHSRIAIGNGQTMWTWNVGRKILRAARINAEIVTSQKAPF